MESRGAGESGWGQGVQVSQGGVKGGAEVRVRSDGKRGVGTEVPRSAGGLRWGMRGSGASR